MAWQQQWDEALETTRDLIRASTSPGIKFGAGLILAFDLCYTGRLEEALAAAEEARQVCRRIGFQRGVSTTKWIDSWIHLQTGDYQRTRECRDEAREIAVSTGSFTPWLALLAESTTGMIDIREGRFDDAGKRLGPIDGALANIAETQPDSEEMARYRVALYRAELLIAEGSFDKAISACSEIPHVTIPTMNTEAMFHYNSYINRDMLARALVGKGMIDEAIAEYEKLTIPHPESDDRRLIYHVFHYRLGVLYEGKGLNAKAADRYQRFLAYCGDADPRMTEVPDARRRLDALFQTDPR